MTFSDKFRFEIGGRWIELHYLGQSHTDNIAVGPRLKQRYPTNWELAGARAASVVRLLSESGVANDRLSAVSFGPFYPVESNDTSAGRARNRRIEIRLLPR